ncbi:MAG: zinc-dependent alcohol dehydrogenase family protein [Propionibacteriaceae bacterium]|jgi:alcohol dehydrogenase|nr:zinc-dependent alcohol dehydrogenase family protein [Propionibacteriaceae bacterium]
MFAWRYNTYGGPIDVVEMPDPACPADGAVLKVEATGVCRSDWHAWRGHDPVPLPMVPGHEFAGEIVAVGPGVRSFVVGERVTSPFVNGCGSCSYCLSGQAQVCPEQTQPGFTHPGSFAEYVVVQHADMNLVQLPDALAYESAASLGCRFATAYHALTAQAGLRTGEWLLVVGAGGVGLSAIDVGKGLGARVAAVDTNPAALELAREMGADVVLGFDELGSVLDLTDGGPDVSLDAVGRPETAAAAVRSLRRRGRHVQVGLMLGPNAEAPLPWADVIAKELRVIGSHGMAAADYPAMLEAVASGKMHPQKLIGKRISFGGLGRALQEMDGVSAPGITVANM